MHLGYLWAVGTFRVCFSMSRPDFFRIDVARPILKRLLAVDGVKLDGVEPF